MFLRSAGKKIRKAFGFVFLVYCSVYFLNSLNRPKGKKIIFHVSTLPWLLGIVCWRASQNRFFCPFKLIFIAAINTRSEYAYSNAAIHTSAAYAMEMAECSQEKY